MGTPFDRERLLRRARERLARRGPVEGKELAEYRHAVDYISIIGLEKLVGWLSKRGFILEFSNGISVYDPAHKKITLTAKSSLEHQLYSLLHECGHLLIDKSGKAMRMYTNGYPKIDYEVGGRDVLHKVDVIGEEYEAWNKGLGLAVRLGIYVRRDEFDRLKARSISSYFRWALKRGRVKD